MGGGTFAVGDAGDDEEGEREDGGEDGAEAVGAGALFLLDGEVAEAEHVFYEH